MRFVKILLAVLSLLVLISVAQADEENSNSGSRAEDDRPNILFIYLDDFGWRDTGFMGSDFFDTPNLDRLAARSLVFTDAYSGAANCAPARACLLSGQYSPRHRIFNVGTGPRGDAAHRRLLHEPGTDVLDRNIVTWAQRLQESGYRTASMGKWHLSDDPLPYGFDLNIGGTHSGMPPRGYYPPHPDAPGLEDAPEGEYLTDRLASESISFIQQSRDEPWCLYLTHFAVHTPLNAKKELVEFYEEKPAGELHSNVKMATMIRSVDDGVGRILEAIDELGLADKTAIVFYSDNGGHGTATDMEPLKGYKGTYYEGGIRVPLFIHLPDSGVQGEETSIPVTGVDLYPTLCELAGASMPEGQPADGVSLLPLVKGEPMPELMERPIFWHFPAYLQSYNGRHIFEQRDVLFRTRPCSVVRKGKWKLHQYFEDDAIELYNLETDIGETTNLADENDPVTQEMLNVLQQWQAEINAPIPTERNPDFDAGKESNAIQNATRQHGGRFSGRLSLTSAMWSLILIVPVIVVFVRKA